MWSKKGFSGRAFEGIDLALRPGWEGPGPRQGGVLPLPGPLVAAVELGVPLLLRLMDLLG